MTKPIPPQTKAIYDYICQFSIDHIGNPPPVQTIARQFNLGFTAVFNRLSQLEDAGMITFSREHGGIEVVGGRWLPPETK